MFEFPSFFQILWESVFLVFMNSYSSLRLPTSSQDHWASFPHIFDRSSLQMRKANKPPSEWLKLLCKDWAMDNGALVESVDAKFLLYKSYLKGMLSPQLLCRLSLPPKDGDGTTTPNPVDFWAILGIDDDFDKAYIIAQIERFSSLYNIRGPASTDDVDGMFSDHLNGSVDSATAAAAGEFTLLSLLSFSLYFLLIGFS
jgi:hypothetical protein